MRSLRFAKATVEMTYKKKASFNSQTLKVNKRQKYLKICIEKNNSRHSILKGNTSNTSSRLKKVESIHRIVYKKYGK